MAFCSSCGAQMNGSFCGTCGAQARSAAAPAPPVQGTTPPPAYGKKKTSPIVWILGGMVAVFVLMAVVLIGAGFFVSKKMGLDSGLAQKNPILAAAKIAVSLNPELEIVTIDENNSTITVREKKTGKTITMNADEVQQGKISFSDESTGEKMSFGGTDVKLPSWVPQYPGAKAEGGLMSASGKDGEGGMAHFKTSDSASKVLAFYQDALKGAGYKITGNIAGDAGDSSGGMVTAEEPSTKRTVAVTVGSGSEGTDVAITYGSKK